MKSYFIAPNMKDMRFRVEANNIDTLRKRIIKEFPKDKDWTVEIFDYYQKHLGTLSFDGVKGHPAFWFTEGSWEAKGVNPKTGRLM